MFPAGRNNAKIHRDRGDAHAHAQFSDMAVESFPSSGLYSTEPKRIARILMFLQLSAKYYGGLISGVDREQVIGHNTAADTS